MENYLHRNDNVNFSSTITRNGQTSEFDLFRNAVVFTILSVFSLITVFGNSMVILVVLCRKNLQSPTGYMILSLAVADLIVGLIVMPFNITHEVWQHQWYFGLELCDFWHSVDVLASTASIWNLCLLAIDRYIAVNDPLNYRQRITLRKALFFIGLVWFVSCIISFPAIVWWRFTAAQLYTNDSICEFTDDLGYLVFSSLISFYVPLFIIVYAYWRVYIVASAFQRQLKTGQHTSAFSPGVHMRVHRGGTPGNEHKFKTMGNQQQTIVNVSMLLLTTGADDSSISSSQLDNLSSVTVSSALIFPNRKAATATTIVVDEKSPLRDRDATPSQKTPLPLPRSFRRRVCMQRYSSTNTMCSPRQRQEQPVAPKLTFRDEESTDCGSNMTSKSVGRLSKIRAK
uniref:G-protein coupled receptors family 1 profile domain-containing protein n=1 Tax=Romanomermis culicivorax TaxID=13658 RepID=A0A915JYU8_ROMCU